VALGDIQIYDGPFSEESSKLFKVVASSNGPGSIKSGELVLVGALGATTAKSGAATRWGNSVSTKPSVGTDYVLGIATSTSTETATVAGTVAVMEVMPGMTFLIAPATAALWDTQAEYDALVGARVLLTTSATGVQTISATDYGGNATNGLGNGLVVEPLNITTYPGKVRFSLKSRLNPKN